MALGRTEEQALSPARSLALKILRRIEDRDAYASETLSKQLEQSKLSQQDKGFTTSLVYGVTGTSGTLDELLSRYAHAPSKLKSKVRTALKLSLFELFFTERESYAIVSQGVDLVGSIHPYSKRVANAILRSAERERRDFPFGDPKQDQEVFARQQGAPVFLLKKLTQDRGPEKAELVFNALRTPAPLFLYVPNEHEAGFKKSIEAKMIHRGEGGSTWISEKSAEAIKSPLITKREVLVMDKNAQQTVYVVARHSKGDVLEIGSGRGTKSLMFASELGNKNAHVVGVDIHEFKRNLLEREAQERGIDTIKALAADATDPSQLARALSAAGEPVQFSAVLVDAPCTGIGTLRRHVDKIWKISQKDIDALAEVGRKLIMSASTCVAEDGVLVYASCTMTREENEEVIEKFLDSSYGREFKREPLSEDDLIEGSISFVDELGQFMSTPSIGEGDGHFISVLRRRKGNFNG